MAIQRIEQVSCGLNLGLPWELSYEYSPQDGVRISIKFVRPEGEYNFPTLLPLQKTSIKIGPAQFFMYPIRAKKTFAANRRIISVDFVDDTFQLENYFVVQTGRGCGQNVFQLGTPVDNRSSTAKLQSAIDRTAEQIKQFTQFQDLEYTFNDFLSILRQKFTVEVSAAFDQTITNAFWGTFREVLGAWCNFFNLSFFFEAGKLKIFDPSKLTINLPSQPLEANEFEEEEDITDTYDKTVWNYFQQEGGEFDLGQSSNTNDGPLLVRTHTLYPIGYEFELSQTSVDLNQVAAAMYGKEFWFLYNFYKGTTSQECGWLPLINGQVDADIVAAIQSKETYFSLLRKGLNPVVLDEDVFDQKFEAYSAYGNGIGGRWYLSNEQVDTAIDETYQWFDESEGQIFDFTVNSDKIANIEYLKPAVTGPNIIESTAVNKFFPGINFIGKRLAYYDGRKINIETEFNLGSLKGLVEQLFETLFAADGSGSFDFSEFASISSLGNKRFLAYQNITIPQSITNLFDNIDEKASLFEPRFSSIPIKGVNKNDYTALKAAEDESDNIEIITGSTPTIVSNTSIIKTVKSGNYKAYYNKYERCKSASTNNNLFSHKFEPQQISNDIPVGIAFTKQANNTYRLTRDYSLLNNLVDNPLLSALAQPRTFPTRRVSFSVNYFYNVPVNFLTEGLVSMSIIVGDGGVQSTYTFSNEVLQVPNRFNEFQKLEQNIRNSLIRKYKPQETIT